MNLIRKVPKVSVNSMSKKVKTVLVGDAGVGKTCIAERISHNSFNDNTFATVGAANLTVSIPSSRGDVTFNIWDTAGQERYRSLAPMYFTAAYCAILVFDITSKESFQTLDTFYENLQYRAPNECIYVLVGNKSDLANQRQVEKDLATDYSHKIGAVIYTETSALTGDGIKELFTQIAECPDLHFEPDVSDQYITDLPPSDQSGKKGCC